ncbi:nuclear transport factor 2 family protein [Pseudotabrizicola algicola]|uniref:Nuclear transport factor 2 family protein n=1 Tax=Pseudotabrizicola algicola TaxID=2709381 RepID=A0A6B3RKW0_9RHOB|nr:nuclear transport factor 2 family protein [Pseudotabrizicola algicola]NEX46707.1 nuclear transport factor 2 family protein [Pseudotabrizicola algicola]
MDTTHALQTLLDREAISALIRAYCYHFDRNEPEQLAALFTPDAVVDYGPEAATLHGADAIHAAVATGLNTTFAATSHHVSNIDIRLESEDFARSICYLYAWHRYHSGAPDGELWAQYHHEFLRTPQGWKISRLTLKAAGMKDFHRRSMHPIGRR